MNASMLQDGYYLSAYVTIDPLANLYAVRLVNRHDQNAALWEKRGERIHLVHFWEFERITGKKHHSYAWYSKEQFLQVMDTLLVPLGIGTKDLRAIWGVPQIEPHEPPNRSEYTYHTICHLFSSLLLDTDLFYHQSIISLALDYGADFETEIPDRDTVAKMHEYIGCFSDHGNITYFPIESPAAMWSVAAEYHGMEEGSLMALASASTCRLLEQKFDFELRIKKIRNSEAAEIYERFAGPIMGCTEQSFRACTTGYDERFSLRENQISAVMKVIQEYSFHAMGRQIDEILSRFSLNAESVHLSMSGGFSLNCPTNSFLMEKYGFRSFIAPPCINDSGQALGIGLYEFYRNGVHLQFHFGGNAFYGNEASFSPALRQQLSQSRFVSRITPFDASVVSSDLMREPIVWVDGQAEIGPRALGHRSLLSSPMAESAKDRLNEIKQRQFWRPVAPVVLEDHMADWFEAASSSPYMLRTFRVLPEKRALVPAILHLDGTARAQTISDRSDRLWTVLHAFYQKTGVPILCNTSLNDRGEPIIDQPLRAVEFALQKNIRVVYINGWRVELQQHEKYDGSLHTEPPICLELPDRDQRKQAENPFGVSAQVISKLKRTIKHRYEYDLTDPDDACRAEQMYGNKK